MKLKNALIAAVVVIAATCMMGCRTTDFEKQIVGESLAMGTLPVKDFVVLGPVIVTATETVEENAFESKREGSEIISALLMEKVIEMGGHDVINVKISKKENSRIILGGIFGKKATYTYTATGLVVKYTETLKGENGAQKSDNKTDTTPYGEASGLGSIALPF